MTRPELLQTAKEWLAGDPDESTRAELVEALRKGDEADLLDRFGTRLEFGTAGLRGTFGAGTNRINRAIVIQTSAGLARYLLDQVPGAADRGVVIGYDGRRLSREFSEDTAAVLAAAGIRAYLFESVVPTPVTAFAVGDLGAAGGVMVTASHNPPDYNGYKVYWGNAAQIIPPHDAGIAAAIDRIGPANEVARMPLEEARKKGLVREVPPEVEARYFARVEALAVHPGVRPPLKIVYTPMHGVGDRFAHEALRRFGFSDVTSVPEQAAPDGAFPTVAFPNPEEKGAMDLSFALARKLGADLVLANDPDADRLAVAVPEGDGFFQLTGNQVGVLVGYYLLTEGDRSGDRLVISTIVSSPMLGDLARTLGVAYDETLTGFKWIANRAMDAKASEGKRFVFGYEEALGYSVGEIVRDKDGVSAVAVVAEIAAVCRARGTTIGGMLEKIYREHGLYVSRQRSVTIKGLDGAAKIAQMMERLRAAPPSAVAGRAVHATRDYLTQQRIEAGGRSTPLALPPSNVLAFELDAGARVIVRPSGTEPKIKIYLDHREVVAPGEPLAAARERAERALAALEGWAAQIA